MIDSIEKGRKEDGNRSIADKIIKRLHDLNKTVESNQGRWAWELLQNAKDSVAEDDNRTISIQIVFDEDKVEFRHNGIHFTEHDVRGIINQISSKETEEGQHSKNTGRFGTGFLTTHVLSKVVRIKGILETVKNEFYSFEFTLDREGKTTHQLIPKIENAWTEFHKSTKKIDSNYNNSKFNTSFCYCLDSVEQRAIAKIGIKEFIKLLPFVLAFIPKIERVEIINKTNDKNIVFERNQKLEDSSIISISKTDNTTSTNILILYASDEKVSIAAVVDKSDEGYAFKSLKDIPKLFCDFPLIGTEIFHFPVIVNSFYFNPQTERDGIWLKGKKESVDLEVEENQLILENAVNLFKKLVDQTSVKNYFDFYNISETKIPRMDEKYFDETWYKDKIQKPLREQVFNTKLVQLENESYGKRAVKDLYFPMKAYSDEIKYKLWEFTYSLFQSSVCKKDHLLDWSNLYWDEWKKLSYENLVLTVSKLENIENLSKTLNKNENETFQWLNTFCKFLMQDENNLILFEKYALIPNQTNTFKKNSQLYIDAINDEELVNILTLLGEDWKDRLLSKKVGFGKYLTKKKEEIAFAITEKLKGTINYTENVVKAINLLSEWFENNKSLGKTMFSELYRKRAELFMNTIADKESLYKVMRSKTDLAQLSNVVRALDENPKILENLKGVEELANLLAEFNASDIAELKGMLIVAQGIAINNPKLEITKDVLVSLGVTSIEELEEALKDKDLSSQFNHVSTPNADLFMHAQNLISRAKENIIEHLKSLVEYDCNDREELATTVIGGIKKDGIPIHVVIRPSDNGEVILYYNSEKDTLDYENSELWIDNGIEKPQHLTLGKILKTTGIKKIPV